MSCATARLSAMLLLSVQFLPLGLPLVCEQVRHNAAPGCEQQTAPDHEASLNVERASSTCLNTAFCPTHITAVPVFDVTMLVLPGESELGRLPRAQFAPADPQAPLPPPPEA